jgi:hypothetical protein
VERAYAVAAANLAADYSALLAAKSVASPGAVTLVKRQSVKTILTYGTATLKLGPLLGIVSLAAKTQGKDQTKRDAQVLVGYDAWITGTNPALVAQQLELLMEAAMRSVDRVPQSGSEVYGAAELPQSASVTLDDEEFEEIQEGLYGRRGTLTFPVWDRDSGV